MKIFCATLAMYFLSIAILNAQSVGIGTTTPHSSATLEVSTGSSLSKGILISGIYDGFSASVPDLGAGSRMMFYPARSAFRAGYADGTQWNNVNVGLNSVGIGYNTMATQFCAIALGNGTIASGNSATAFGNNTIASGLYSVAMGSGTNAIGQRSTASGENTTALGNGSVAMGKSTSANGSYSVAMGQNSVASGNISTAMGYQTTASGYYSFTSGFMSSASEFYATAIGNETIATGNSSTAMGAGTLASGGASLATGAQTISSGQASTAMGSSTIASGNYSTTMGFHSRAKGFASTVIGLYNDSILLTNQISISNSTPLFIVGNGTSHTNRSNAMVVLKNGNVGIGDNTPTNPLSFPPLLGKKISLYPGATGDAGFAVQGNQLLIYSDNPSAWVRLGYDQGGIFTNNLDVYGNGNAWLRGTLTQNSDERLKKNINRITNALPLLTQLSGYHYNWKNEKMDAMLQSGVLAQEVRKIFPQLVKEDAEGTLSVNYTGLIPYMIEAAKEQQEQMDELKNENQKLKARLDKIERLLQK